MVVLNRRDAVANLPEITRSGAPGNSTKGARDGRIALSVAVVVIAVAAFVSWMFHGTSLVRMVLPDNSAAPPSGTATPLKSSSAGAQLYAWLAHAEPSLDALPSIQHQIAAAAGSADIAGILGACQSGERIVADVQQHLPSPDIALNTALERTLDDYRLGLRDCLAGVQREDASGVELAAVYLHRATADLRGVMAIIERDLPDFEPNDSDVVRI
ncbi:hypothetical protein FZI85_04170 [Mycobacterium sp. CBMA293]|uniref:hypothetical protein n=1 Tax=unclassified Mycolicibacterium TaxID=2636767 RepID=UPI0012DEE0DE|nr:MULTISPECIES: hypothetical protein [unclassified Mycolicibacterium]MUL47131.1 hypothetical protein [Mycolicibacterium sp. CBMA 360]MUL58509.1 hypothetical protein [Mycolicibacterium sp. CBMA 335]MUL73967.1 hypothetical protein [Mycolicibacterium sp. CBMA 311]MUL93392.1 hypothetical protein [Mycolicibacterium sp. CBMA 230]MUM04607.1 hypothetical protein [Mycolicibacterium sp. CBMA 213]